MHSVLSHRCSPMNAVLACGPYPIAARLGRIPPRLQPVVSAVAVPVTRKEPGTNLFSARTRSRTLEETTMSELVPGVYLVDGVGLPGRPGTVNVCLLVSGDGTATLVDAGFPGVTEPLEATLAEAAMPRAALR